MWVTGQQTHRCDISQHLSLEGLLDVGAVSLLLLHDVFPVRVGDDQASVQHGRLSRGGLPKVERAQWHMRGFGSG